MPSTTLINKNFNLQNRDKEELSAIAASEKLPTFPDREIRQAIKIIQKAEKRSRSNISLEILALSMVIGFYLFIVSPRLQEAEEGSILHSSKNLCTFIMAMLILELNKAINVWLSKQILRVRDLGLNESEIKLLEKVRADNLILDIRLITTVPEAISMLEIAYKRQTRQCLTVMQGLHPRLGENSHLNTTLRQNSLFDRNVLLEIFSYMSINERQEIKEANNKADQDEEQSVTARTALKTN